MKIGKMKEPNQFLLAELGFKELKIIKDSCAAYGKQGSEHAKKIAAELEELLNQISV